MNVILISMLLAAAPTPFEVQTLDGQTLAGRLVELTPDRLTIDTAESHVSLDTERVLSISTRQKSASAPRAASIVVELTDGSTVLARQYTAHGAQAKITLSGGDVLDAPTSIVRTVRLHQESGALKSEWERLIGRRSDSDLLVIPKDQNVDYHQGVLHDVTEDVIQFDLDGELLPVKRSKVYGFAYRHREEAELSPAVCRITDSTGSQWSVRSLGLSTKLEWTTPAGLSVSQPVDKIVQVDFSGGKIVYLSDMKPDDVRWTPYFDAGKPPAAAVAQFYAPRYDRNFDGGPLQLGATQYHKGLALHGRTELVYRLPDRFSHFRAVAGIDDAVRPGGRVRLIIHGDGRELLDTAIAGTDPPRPLDLDVTGVRRLTIVVDFGESLSTGDYLLLCNARLSK